MTFAIHVPISRGVELMGVPYDICSMPGGYSGLLQIKVRLEEKAVRVDHPIERLRLFPEQN